MPDSPAPRSSNLSRLERKTRLLITISRWLSAGFLSLPAVFALGVVLAAPSSAATILNGSFENVGSATSSFSINFPTVLPNWTVTPSGNKVLHCLVMPADITSLCGSPNGWTLQFWNNGAGGNFPGGPSPDGGNFVAIDGDVNYATPMTQALTGLVVGRLYTVEFYQAAAQQYGFDGATTERWQVSLGSETKLSTLMNTANHGYVGWMSQSLTFTAQATNDVLRFLALGTPNGLPPFVLIDGVSVSETVTTPEPSSFALIGGGGLVLLWIKRRARHKTGAKP